MYPQVILIKNKENLGYTGGNNIGMQYAMAHSTDYVWLLNNDTIVEQDTLSKLVASAEIRTKIGLVSPVIHYYDQKEKIQFYGDYVDWRNRNILAIKSQELWGNESIKKNVSLWGTALFIKRSAIERIGYLDEKYFAYCEDCEYCMRVVNAGYQIVMEPKAKIYHKDSQSTGNRRAPLQVFLRTRNIYFFWMDNLKGSDKINYFREYLADAISDRAALRERNLFESSEACFDGVWAAFRGIGGRWDKNIKMPKLIKRLFSWHPYFWVNLLDGNISYIVSQGLNRTKGKIRKFIG
jgi:GT2 family glycosyltransferase